MFIYTLANGRKTTDRDVFLKDIGWRVVANPKGGFDVATYAAVETSYIALPFGGRFFSTGPGGDRYGLSLPTQDAAWDWIRLNAGAGPRRITADMREGRDYIAY